MDDQELKNKEREQADNKMIMDAFNHLLDTYLHSSHRRKVDIITKAFNFARQAHKGVRRLSGEPYIMHPIAVAQIACEEMGLSPAQVCFIGDQIFTDILGANRAGIKSVLVRPINRSTDEIQIFFKRFLEKPVIKAFLKEKKLAGKDDII